MTKDRSLFIGGVFLVWLMAGISCVMGYLTLVNPAGMPWPLRVFLGGVTAMMVAMGFSILVQLPDVWRKGW